MSNGDTMNEWVKSFREKFDVFWAAETLFIYTKARNGKCVAFWIEGKTATVCTASGFGLSEIERSGKMIALESTLFTANEASATRLMAALYQMRDKSETKERLDDLQVTERVGFVELGEQSERVTC